MLAVAILILVSLLLLRYTLKSSGIVESVKLFQHILYANSENKPKIFNCLPRMRQKSLSVLGEHGYFRVVFYVRSRLRIRQKYFSVHGEYAKRI